MASLKTTIVNGTLTVNSSINVNDSSQSWLNGFTYPSIRINNATNNTGYHPWISQKNTFTNQMYSIGTYANSFKLLSSTTSRTENGTDHEIDIDNSSGNIYTNYSLTVNDEIIAGRGDAHAEKRCGCCGAAGIIYLFSQVAATGGQGIWAESNSGSYACAPFIIGADGLISVYYTYLNKQSDRRVKDNITDLLDKEAKIILSEAKVKKFIYKRDLDKNNLQYGIIAQDLRDTLINNNLGYRTILRITDKKDKITNLTDLETPEEKVEYGVDYVQYIPLLIKGWQDHEKEIISLKNEIQNLKNQLNSKDK